MSSTTNTFQASVAQASSFPITTTTVLAGSA
jgi:hypothetical protein